VTPFIALKIYVWRRKYCLKMDDADMAMETGVAPVRDFVSGETAPIRKQF
jgi:hypothetical protein